jgi:hypothetical protein
MSWKKIWLNIRIDERILMYKLEVYQKIFLNFICGSLTSIKVSGQNKETEARFNRIVHEEKVQIEES